MKNIIIRASSLPSYADCARRTASKMFEKQIKKMGYELRETLPSVGAAIGTAVHSFAEESLANKMVFIEPAAKAVEDKALARFESEISKGCLYDDTTPHIDAAILQIKQINRAFLATIYKEIEPVAVELALEADAGDGFIFKGHIDLINKLIAGHAVRDFKTGYLQRPYQSQLGGYYILCKANQKFDNIVELGIDYLPRTPHTKPQKMPVRELYDIFTCEHAAWSTITQIKADYQAFVNNNNPWAFRANPMSLMCSEKFCPAHGTAFCPMGRPSKKWEWGTVE